jgi:hypothetical protein
MVKVKYIGDYDNVNVKLPLGTQRNWRKQEVRDLPEYCANKLVTDNCNFIKVGVQKSEEIQVIKDVKKSDDINIVDKFDFKKKIKEE